MRAIRRDNDHENLVKLLGERPHPDSKQPIFGTMRDVLGFAAAVGFAKKRRSPLSKKTHEIPYRIFESKPELVDFMYLLAAMATKNKDILRPTAENEDEVATIFEEFANGGLEVIEDWLREQPKDAYGAETLIAKLQSEFMSDKGPKADVTAEDVKFD